MTLLKYLNELMELKVEKKMRYDMERVQPREGLIGNALVRFSLIESMTLDELLKVIVERKLKKLKN